MRDVFRNLISFAGLVALGALAMGTGGEDPPNGSSTPSPCAPYDATSAGPWQYIGQVDLAWQDNSTTPPSSDIETVRFSFNVECMQVDNQGVSLWITSATISNAVFGTGTQTLDHTSFMTMPPNPPTTPSNLVQPGQGVFFGFPNGTQFGVAAKNVGDFSVLGYASHISIASSPGVMPAVDLLLPAGSPGLVAGHPNAVLTPKSWALNSAT